MFGSPYGRDNSIEINIQALQGKTDEEIEMICDIAIDNNLWIIADEVYREFIYEGEYTSLGNIDRVKDKVIIIDSVSKRYSACGARIGCVSSKNKDYISSMLKLCQARLSVPTLEQVGAKLGVTRERIRQIESKTLNDEVKLGNKEITCSGSNVSNCIYTLTLKSESTTVTVNFTFFDFFIFLFNCIVVFFIFKCYNYFEVLVWQIITIIIVSF